MRKLCMSARWASLRGARKKGFTLVELIVTFALTGILLAAAATTLVTYLNVFSRVNDTALAYTLMDTLSETVAGTVSAAQRSRLSEEGEVRYFVLTSGDSYDTVELCDRYGEHVLLHIVDSEAREGAEDWQMGASAGSEGGYIELYYYRLYSTETLADGSQKVKRESVHWGLGEGVYDGYKITGFKLTPEEGTNRLTLELTVENSVTSRRFTTTRLIECYNLTYADMKIG